MIFVTVGSDIPFDRLVKAVDSWAAASGRNDVFAQIGENAWQPEHIPFAPLLDPPDFDQKFSQADVIVAHAGMGTILTALQTRKPVLVMPRHGSLGETRNEHQLATARHLKEKGAISVAMDEDELKQQLDAIESLATPDTISPHASRQLIDGLQGFIHQ